MNENEFDNLSYTQKKEAVELLNLRYWIIRGGLLAVTLLVIGMTGCPQYKVWKDGLVGKAELRKSEWNRKIIIEEAKAKEESAISWAQAEVNRAKGSADANEILSASLGGSERYLHWLFIDMMNNTKNQVIYLPTETGLPILEANRLNHLDLD